VPYYYNTGFYYGPGGRIVVWGFPSYAYSNGFSVLATGTIPIYIAITIAIAMHLLSERTSRGRYGGYYSNRNDYGSRRIITTGVTRRQYGKPYPGFREPLLDGNGDK